MNNVNNNCPSPEAMGCLAAGELEPSERARILDHAVGCDSCGQELALFRPLREWASESAAAIEGRRGGGARRLVDALLPVAAVLFLAAGAVLWLRPIEPGGGVERGGEAAVWVQTPPAGATLPEAPRVLELTLPQGTEEVSYEFQLFDRELAVVWRSGWLGRPRVELPEEVRRQLRPGETYSWRVVVNEGLASRASPAADFVVLP